MEGKSVLFKVLGGMNAIPLCIATQDLEEIIKFAKIVEPNFGAVNEDRGYRITQSTQNSRTADS
jgi:malic enzyme